MLRVPREMSRRWLVVLSIVVWSVSADAAVGPVCDGTTLSRAAYPNDRFTVPDASQNTGLRVNLPKPDCTLRRSDCQDIDLINTLDGFSLQPRLTIPFDGVIDVRTVTSETMYLVSLGDTVPPPVPEQPRRIGVTRVQWDPATMTLVAEPAELLAQHTRYAIILTDGIRDASGLPIVIPASCPNVFTTRSVTAFLEKVRDRVKASTPERADFLLGPARERTAFHLSDIQAISASRQTGVNPSRFTTSPISFNPLSLVPGAVAAIAFGRYSAFDYLTHPGEFIAPFGTATGTPIKACKACTSTSTSRLDHNPSPAGRSQSPHKGRAAPRKASPQAR